MKFLLFTLGFFMAADCAVRRGQAEAELEPVEQA